MQRIERQWSNVELVNPTSGAQLVLHIHKTCYKEPRSIQVVIFTSEDSPREYLLLHRAPDCGGFWQSVTGSLEESESHLQAAAREVAEETGIAIGEGDLISLDLVNRFEIAAVWRSRYAPGITVNEEVCFALRVERCEIKIDPSEHDGYRWVTYEAACKMLYWESTKRAFIAAGQLQLPSASKGN